MPAPDPLDRLAASAAAAGPNVPILQPPADEAEDAIACPACAAFIPADEDAARAHAAWHRVINGPALAACGTVAREVQGPVKARLDALENVAAGHDQRLATLEAEHDAAQRIEAALDADDVAAALRVHADARLDRIEAVLDAILRHAGDSLPAWLPTTARRVLAGDADPDAVKR